MSDRDAELARLEKKLDTLIAVLAAQVGADLPLSERAPLLHRLGLDRSQIARVCGTAPQVVSVRLAEARRQGRLRKRGTGREKS